MEWGGKWREGEVNIRYGNIQQFRLTGFRDDLRSRSFGVWGGGWVLVEWGGKWREGEENIRYGNIHQQFRLTGFRDDLRSRSFGVWGGWGVGGGVGREVEGRGGEYTIW